MTEAERLEILTSPSAVVVIKVGSDSVEVPISAFLALLRSAAAAPLGDAG